jgi:tryptophan halogenase
MNSLIKKVVVLGGGTSGWISAALLKKNSRLSYPA